MEKKKEDLENEVAQEKAGEQEAIEESAEPAETGEEQQEKEAVCPEKSAKDPEEESAGEAEVTATEKEKKKKSNRLYDIVIAAGILMLLGGGIAVFLKYKSDQDTKEMYSDLENSFLSAGTESDSEIDWGFDWVSGDGSASASSTVWYNQISVDFDGLNDINEDVVGWIVQENGEFSYPIMYSGDNDEYLRRTLFRDETTSGSIFIDGLNDPYFQDNLTVVYGHNMKNGTMFGSLRNYKEDGYYDEHQYFQIYTEEGMAYRYQVFAYFDIDEYDTAMVDSKFYDPEDPETAITTEVQKGPVTSAQGPEMEEVILNKDNTYSKYLEIIKSRSLLESDLEVTTEDKIVALFTCSTHKGNRFIVYGVQVADHNFNETADQNTDLESLDR